MAQKHNGNLKQYKPADKIHQKCNVVCKAKHQSGFANTYFTFSFAEV